MNVSYGGVQGLKSLALGLPLLFLAEVLHAIEIAADVRAVALHRVLPRAVEMLSTLETLGHRLKYNSEKLFCNAITISFDNHSSVS